MPFTFIFDQDVLIYRYYTSFPCTSSWVFFSPNAFTIKPVHDRLRCEVSNQTSVRFRRWLLLPIVVIFARCVFFLGGFHWIKFKGTRATRKEAPILVVAPHSSFFDSLVVVALGMPSVVGKTESAESFVRGFFKVLQPILVNREDPDSRKKAIQELNRRAKSKEDWPQIVIFPEGTCTNRSCIATFKSGAFNAGVPVQPVVIRWPNKCILGFEKRELSNRVSGAPISNIKDCVTWVCEGPSVWKLLWLTMTQLYNNLEIEFLPVYQPNEDEQLDAQLYADNIRRIMAGYLEVPLCDLSYDDFCQIRIACRYKLPAPEGNCLFKFITSNNVLT
ncbi:unnamed protein product [Heterobilharzia americana]|nr:unnamed protein product [Heterobilharzia americana]